MTDIQKVDAYIKKHSQWSKQLEALRVVFKNTELKEEIKWGSPTYTLNGKLIAGMAAFNNHYAIWFHQGVFLTDSHNLLINAQEGKTKGMRSIKIKSINDVPREVMKDYFNEAIENQKLGLEIKAEKKKELIVPVYFRDFLKKKNIEDKFDVMSLSCRREYVEYIDSAKKDETKVRRMEKSCEMIKEDIGLNDKYRK